MNESVRTLPALGAATAPTPAALGQDAVTGLLFRASGDKDFATEAAGTPVERGTAIEPALATTAFDFTPDQLGEDPSARPDLGIGIDDVGLKVRAVAVTVRGLGSAAAPGGTLFLEGPSGRTLASTKIAALAAPTDPSPETAKVRLMVPAGAAVETLRLAPADGGREIAMRTNVLPPAAVTRR